MLEYWKLCICLARVFIRQECFGAGARSCLQFIVCLAYHACFFVAFGAVFIARVALLFVHELAKRAGACFRIYIKLTSIRAPVASVTIFACLAILETMVAAETVGESSLGAGWNTGLCLYIKGSFADALFAGNAILA